VGRLAVRFDIGLKLLRLAVGTELDERVQLERGADCQLSQKTVTFGTKPNQQANKLQRWG
jgi:hypothetical protein